MTWEGSAAAGQTNGGVGWAQGGGAPLCWHLAKRPIILVGEGQKSSQTSPVRHIHMLLHGPVPVAVLSLSMTRYIKSNMILFLM